MYDALYARQSVEKVDSISIESQLEYCRHEARGNPCREYIDRGYSGRNTNRPAFEQLLADVRQGKVARVIVYKLDRISRSILDFANMMQLFQQHRVEFVSSTERFDTSTPIGRAMLHICIVFAQLERETIQKRVTDAYYSRCKKGLYMGGRVPYGFARQQTVLDPPRIRAAADIMEACVGYILYRDWFHAHTDTPAQRIRRYIDRHYAEKLSLDELAQAVFMSRSALCQYVRQEMGTTVNRLIEEKRMEVAKEWLSLPGRSIIQAADACGYSDTNYFTRRFKKHTGMTPSAYRETRFSDR